MDGKKIREISNYYVVQQNDLIRARYSLTTQQEKIVKFAVSKIKKNDRPGQWYEISIEEFCDVCGLKMDDTGYYYTSIKKDLRELTNRIWIHLPDRSEKTFSWFSDAHIMALNGTVQIKFHEMLEDYLFLIEKPYTQYKFESIRPFQNRYSIRLFEILYSTITSRQRAKKEPLERLFSVKELRELLAVETDPEGKLLPIYPRWADFERYILRRAKEEINTYSDVIRIEYDTYKNGKAVESVNFIISFPTAGQQYMAHEAVRSKTLEKKSRKPSKKTIEKQKRVKQLLDKMREIEEQITQLPQDSPLFETLDESRRMISDTLQELTQKNLQWEGREDG